MQNDNTMAANAENNGGIGLNRGRLAAWAAGVGAVLLVPLIAMQFTDEVKWDLFDFVVMGALLFGTALIYELIASKGGTTAYRVAVGIACVTGLFLVWVNAAVGIIGDEDSANVMYLGVIAVGFIGAFLARFQPQGMVRALAATAAAQALVPAIALTWVPAIDFAPGVGRVFALNGVFVALWVGSALLFRESARGGRERYADIAQLPDYVVHEIC